MIRHENESATSTEELTNAENEFRFRRFRMTVLRGPDQGKEYVSTGSRVCVGTAESNNFVLSDPAISRHHCEISVKAEGFHLSDLNSTNGTTVGALRVESVLLEGDVVIGLGTTLLQFEALREEMGEPLSLSFRFGELLGQSVAMRRVFALLKRIAPTDATVLLEGETGTGKGLVARMIHAQSRRAQAPWIVVDCGAIPPTLVESELFGFEKGAFTGAFKERVGCFEAANGGTLFLDEIGELPLDLQPKLLRALEDRTVQRIGSTRAIQIDARIIAATNRDLRQAVNRGSFRPDLFYRLDILRLRIPPLRERREDIPMLVSEFYADLAGRGSRPPEELIQALKQQEWPGNVRELRSAVERTVVTGDPSLWAGIMEEESSDSKPIELETAKSNLEDFDSTSPFRNAKAVATARWERRYILEIMRRHAGNISQAARAAQMDRSHLSELVRRYGVKIE